MVEEAKRTSRKVTGRQRRMRTRRSVLMADALARWLITIGGIGTIVAVSFVFLYLAWVALPLFGGGEVGAVAREDAAWLARRPIRVGINEYRNLGWALYEDGVLESFRLDNGRTIQSARLVDGKRITAVSVVDSSDTMGGPASVAIGFADGSAQFGRLGFDTEFRDSADMPEEVKTLGPDAVMEFDGFLAQKTPQGQIRLQKLGFELQDPVALADSAVILLDHMPSSNSGLALGGPSYRYAFWSAAGKAGFGDVSASKNAFTGKLTWKREGVHLPASDLAGKPLGILMTGIGDNVVALSDKGDMVRYDVRDRGNVTLAERQSLLRESAERLTVCGMMLGRETIVCADSDGHLDAWFRVRDVQRNQASDGYRFTRVHELPRSDVPLTSLGASQRSRMLCAGYEDGMVKVFHVTTNQLVAEFEIPGGSAIFHAKITPKDDGLVACADGQLYTCDFDPAYPETTLASLFRPVWYEGYEEPIHMWQSSSAGVGPEMKLGMWPLIFGTIKATFYTMLFATPLALAAAIYTSEFMSSRARACVKPSIELMASLPSVVLGFLAALVFAPIVEKAVPLFLCLFVMIPFSVLLFAHLFQMLPTVLMMRLERYRVIGAVPAVMLGMFLAYLAAPHVENLLFAGDVKRWLDGQIGNGVGAWMLLLLPLSAVATVLVTNVFVNSWIRNLAANASRLGFAWMSLAKFLMATAFCVGLAYGISLGLDGLGWDPRGSYVDTYQQRNALVVGFVMGFAVIPIIYTIADDALITVPGHLRSASLGCGATMWQTTQRIVLPTAMSGIFSALMIGMGRAVGETMIVLMAGGNTPVAEWNIFNGFRTLSANIAVELPEAVKDSTHFRTLFLAALTLFVLTFVINTVAEFVRLRFRRRAYQL